MTTKTCTKCTQELPLSAFGRSGKAKDGLRSRCKLCRSDEKREYYARNRERLRKYNARWSRQNRDYLNAAGRRRYAIITSLPDVMSNEDREEVMRRYDYACCLTGEQNSHSGVQIDHVIPFNIGHGGSVPYNVWPIAGYLNQSKGDSNVFTWARSHPDVDRFRFRAAIIELSKRAGLSPDEYEAFVNWCHANPRTIEEIAEDSRDSIEIWRESIATTEAEAA